MHQNSPTAAGNAGELRTTSHPGNPNHDIDEREGGIWLGYLDDSFVLSSPAFPAAVGLF